MKEKSHRRISVIVILAMLIATMNVGFAVPALAASEESEGQWETTTFISPAYKDVTEEEILKETKPILDAMEDDFEALYESGVFDGAQDNEEVQDGSLPGKEFYSVSDYPTYYVDSAEEAADYLREMMKKRENAIRVIVRFESGIACTLNNDVYDLAVEHNGDPEGGDYLVYHFGGGSTSMTFRTIDNVQCAVIDFAFLYYDDAAQENAVSAEIDRVLSALELDGRSNLEKLYLIYNYVTSSVTYDYDNLNVSSYKLKFSAYAALIDKTAVCQGYANLMYRMMLACGIDNRIVTSIDHAWNMVQMGDEYYFIDATWDANPPEGYDYYFLRSKPFFDYDHELSPEFYEPEFADYYTFAESDFDNYDIHNMGEQTVIMPASCNYMGFATSYCQDCNYKDSVVLNPKGHNFPAGQYTTDWESTCTRAGRESIHCTRCWQSTKERPLSYKGHEREYIVVPAGDLAGYVEERCKNCKMVFDREKIPAYDSTKLSKTKYVYDGTAKKPSVKVLDFYDNPIDSEHYKISYTTGRTKVGKYKVKITFRNYYADTKSVTKTFTIVPKGTTLRTLTRLTKGFKVTWKKQAVQTSGYQIRYSTKSGMGSAKTVTVTKNSTVSKKITKLKAKKKYYVQVRTYKTVNGVKYYSSWSEKKSVTTK